MEETTRTLRLSQVFADFEKGVQFHALSFREIDEKAKYWLTLALPSLFGLIGYGFQKGQELSPYLEVVFSSVSVCLFCAIYYFARTLGTETVRAGITRPDSSNFVDVYYFFESTENWVEYNEFKVKTAFEALDFNESCNYRKSGRLKSAEALLFIGVPGSSFLAVCLAFADSRVAHGWWSTTPASVAIGIAVGILVAAAILLFAHNRFLK